MSGHQLNSKKPNSEKQLQRDPYEVLDISPNSTNQDIKTTYEKMAPSSEQQLFTTMANSNSNSNPNQKVNKLGLSGGVNERMRTTTLLSGKTAWVQEGGCHTTNPFPSTAHQFSLGKDSSTTTTTTPIPSHIFCYDEMISEHAQPVQLIPLSTQERNNLRRQQVQLPLGSSPVGVNAATTSMVRPIPRSFNLNNITPVAAANHHSAVLSSHNYQIGNPNPNLSNPSLQGGILFTPFAEPTITNKPSTAALQNKNGHGRKRKNQVKRASANRANFISNDDDENYDGRIHSLPYKKNGPYTCPKCYQQRPTSQSFAAHVTSCHYKNETRAQKMKRLYARLRRRTNLRLQKVNGQITFLPDPAPVAPAPAPAAQGGGEGHGYAAFAVPVPVTVKVEGCGHQGQGHGDQEVAPLAEKEAHGNDITWGVNIKLERPDA